MYTYQKTSGKHPVYELFDIKAGDSVYATVASKWAALRVCRALNLGTPTIRGLRIGDKLSGGVIVGLDATCMTLHYGHSPYVLTTFY